MADIIRIRCPSVPSQEMSEERHSGFEKMAFLRIYPEICLVEDFKHSTEDVKMCFEVYGVC